jgi:phage host-nuclease inhibitor protein Gam
MGRMNCFDYRELNGEAAKRRSATVNHAKHPLARRLQNARADVKVLTDLASWCEVSRDELEVLIAWCLKI